LASVLPLPQRYYVPQRLRDVHRPRLEASGLWTTSDFEEEEKKSKAFKVVKPKIGGERETHTRIFLREKVKSQNHHCPTAMFKALSGTGKGSDVLRQICQIG